MPEGPQVARYARLQSERLAGKIIHSDSPDGRSDDVASLIDGRKLRTIEAIGKHMIYAFAKDLFLHVHLGRFGHFDEGPMPLPEPRGILRFRMYTNAHWYELRGAIAIDIYDAERRSHLLARIGPNPLDPNADIAAAFKKIRASKSPIGALLMDQSVVGGIGNIYRSEALYVNRVNPWLRGTDLAPKAWRGIWKELVRVMAHGADIGRIVTTLPKDRKKPNGAVRREDRFYVYHREGLPCRRCGAPIQSATIANRKVFWCPVDQPAPASALRPPARPAG